MAQIEAIFQGGVFKPLGEVRLPENQRVKLQVEPIGVEYALTWLERVRRRQQEMIERHGGYFPDSTPDIAEDRMRDA